MAKKGILGKIIERVTPDDEKEKPAQKAEQGGGGLLGKAVEAIKDRFEGDDEKKREERREGDFDAGPSTANRVEAQSSGSVGTSTPPAMSEPQGSAPSATATATGPDSEFGMVHGSGTGREYVTREGDTLEAIGAYFYGDPIHAQRLIDDKLPVSAARAAALGLADEVGQRPDGLGAGDAHSVPEIAVERDAALAAGFHRPE